MTLRTYKEPYLFLSVSGQMIYPSPPIEKILWSWYKFTIGFPTSLGIQQHAHTRGKPYEYKDYRNSVCPGSHCTRGVPHTIGKHYECHQCGKALSSSNCLQSWKKRLIWEKDTINVSHILKASTITGVSKHTNEPIMKRNPINVTISLKHLDQIHLYSYTKGLLWRGNPINTIGVIKALLCACVGHLQRQERGHTGEKPYEWNQCGNAFAHPSHFQKHELLLERNPMYRTIMIKAFAWKGHFQKH